jgi:F420-dependent oxidoreductase-like protein
VALTELAVHAETLGYTSAWASESYGSDAVVPLTWIASRTTTIRVGTGIMQMPARTPASAAMTAATLDTLSDGRLLLGLGVSGPQVAEGWHGQPYGKPLGRTREYVAVVRDILARTRPLEHHGEHYDIPYTGPGATGLGKALKSSIAARPNIPIYLAAIGPRNVALATEIADGFLPVFFSPTRWRDAFGDALADRDIANFDIAASVQVALGDDLDACRDDIRPFIALYVGGMGARGRNFYNDLACRYGYEEAAGQIQDLYLAGHKRDAEAAVPDELIDELALVGSAERIADGVQRWKESAATTLVVTTRSRKALEVVAAAAL